MFEPIYPVSMSEEAKSQIYIVNLTRSCQFWRRKTKTEKTTLLSDIASIALPCTHDNMMLYATFTSLYKRPRQERVYSFSETQKRKANFCVAFVDCSVKKYRKEKANLYCICRLFRIDPASTRLSTSTQ